MITKTALAALMEVHMVWDLSTIPTKDLYVEMGKRAGLTIESNCVYPSVYIEEQISNKDIDACIDWDVFSGALTTSDTLPFGKWLSEQEREAMSYLMQVYIDNSYNDLRLLAYALATVRIECGPKMMPVREGFSPTDKLAREYVTKRKRGYAKEIGGHVYYGRGYVQLTWQRNYVAAGIAENPDKALEPKFAANLLYQGLLDGRWNAKGHGLMYYLKKNDPVEARRTVNVMDLAEHVADIYTDFYHALLEAWRD